MRARACRLCQQALKKQEIQFVLPQRRFQSSTSTGNASGSSASSSSAGSSSTSQDPSIASLLHKFGGVDPSSPSKSSLFGLPSSSSSSSSSASPSASTSSSNSPIFDPLRLVGNELSSLNSNVQKLLGSGHPALDTIAKYYFQAEGKHVRPLIVLLLSQATNGLAPGFEERMRMELAGQKQGDASRGINDPLESRADEILEDYNPDTPSTPPAISKVLPSQRRLAEITEMIHVASLLHDDVIDVAATRRSSPSAPAAFGNKLSILGGDFLLARASLYLSRLGSNEVVELVASVLANLVEGEVMQVKGNAPDSATGIVRLTPEIFEHYMKKTYLKTASLIAKSSRATVVLGGAGEKQGWVEGEKIKDIAYAYGRNLGLAFQLVDDMLDFTGSDASLGKPGQGADLKLGLATAPALYAWEEFPELGAMILRKFSEEGDAERARDLVKRSSGVAQTAALAEAHAQMARDALKSLPESEAKEALEGLTRTVLKRSK